MLQFEIPENCTMPKVVIKGNYFGSKTFPSLNNLLAEYGYSPQRGNSMKRKFMNICNDEIRMQLRGYKAQNPVILHYYYIEPRDGHYRDCPNIHSFFSKVFCDSLQLCGVIPNDNPMFLLNETHDFFYLRENFGEPFIEVYIEEVQIFDSRYDEDCGDTKNIFVTIYEFVRNVFIKKGLF